MASDADDSWPPGNISAMIAEMRADPTSPHWNRVRLCVYSFARRYSVRSNECLADAEDITQDVVAILAMPGKLEAFGRKAHNDTANSEEEQVLPAAFLAWLAVITRRRWLNFTRYVKARPDLASRTSVPNNDEEDTSLMSPDPHADVTHIVEEAMLLEAVTEFLQTLHQQGKETARKVDQLMLLATSTMSYEDVAQRFNCRATQVRDAVHTIRSKLRTKFNIQE